MKFNYKKVATVLGSALMLGSTVAMAAAASFTPSSFTDNGVALVVGSNAANSDLKAAIDLTANLAPATSTTTSTPATIEGGDAYKFEKSSTLFQLGRYIGNVSVSQIDDDEMPSLLAQGEYVDDDNEEFSYKQKIVANNNLQLKLFNENSYKKDTPTIGFALGGNEHVLNYTLDFTDKPYFSKLETTYLPIMDKTYYVLDVDSTNTTITLMDSAADAVIAEGEPTTLTVGGKTYEVSISSLSGTASSPQVKLTVNGETTTSLSATQTRKLSDGAYVGIKDISMRDVAGVPASVELSIGSGKMKIQNDAKVQVNDEDVRNLYGYIVNDSGKLDDIVLQWNTNDKTYITEDTEISMPAFETVKLSFGGMNFPLTETFEVEAGGNDNVVLANFPLKGGVFDIPLIGKAAGNTNYTFIGTDTDELLVTSAGTSVTFDGSSDSNDDMILVSWTDGDDAESYLIRPKNFNDPTSGDDTVGFEYWNNGAWETKYSKVEQGDEITFGNVELTVTTLNSATGVESVVLTATDTAKTSFNTLYSKEGLKVYMPYLNSTNVNGTSCATPAIGELQYFNVLNESNQSQVLARCGAATFDLVFVEEDKDGNKGAGDTFSVTIGNNGASNYYTSVTTVTATNSSGRSKSATDVYETWMYSALATKIVEQDAGDQDYVTITYHGSEVSGDVYLATPGATISGGSTGSTTTSGVMTVYDNEVSSVSTKNLIVIGGSAVNAVASELLGGIAGGDAFTTATGIKSGEAIIKSFARSGKVALLVAGYNAQDTTNAVTYLSNNAIDTTVGKALKVTSATSATAITA